MLNDVKNPLSSGFVCSTLLKHGLISRCQYEKILKKKEAFKRELEKRECRMKSAGLANVPITIIDVIVSLNLVSPYNEMKPLTRSLFIRF